jgi:hypothetical protein
VRSATETDIMISADSVDIYILRHVETSWVSTSWGISPKMKYVRLIAEFLRYVVRAQFTADKSFDRIQNLTMVRRATDSRVKEASTQ